jgi:biopolymer transport protein ExbB
VADHDIHPAAATLRRHWRTRAAGLFAAALFCLGSWAAWAQDADTGGAVAQTMPAHALPHNLSVWNMFLAADVVVKAVLLSLVFASVVTWTILLAKSLELAAAWRQMHAGRAALGSARSLVEAMQKLRAQRCPVTAMVTAAHEESVLSAEIPGEGLKERVISRLERVEAAAARVVNRGTGLLATIGATSPFVGLFGTVWGIMNSFIGISKMQTTNLAEVAPGIAEALLTTAFGLGAAIPAVVIYNYFARQIAGYRGGVADASAEVLRLVSRDLDYQYRAAMAAQPAG